MPMFDLESADKLKLRDCTTDAETMVKATGNIGILDAERCKAGSATTGIQAVKQTLLIKALNCCLSVTGQIVIGVSIFLIGSFLLVYLKL
ncbi:hypothetical protein [Pseudomonas bubulae]|uniref:hypothetical protein n=1 Tax=Pseudomonas bubulae TaxID=2316085 RepID=UPI0030ADB6A4